MWTKFKCCLVCYEIIAADDVSTAELWVDLCGHSIRHDNRLRFRIDHSLNEELKILEDYGFISSHETDKEVWVKMNGYALDDSFTACFCLDDEGHDYEEDEV